MDREDLIDPSLTSVHFSLRILSLLPSLINQTVGDAMSDILFVELILSHYNWSIAQWDELYEDIPSLLFALTVPDRTLFVPTKERESRLMSPFELQREMDGLVSEYERGRGFVRPSGTEDVVRIYVEAKEREREREYLFTNILC